MKKHLPFIVGCVGAAMVAVGLAGMHGDPWITVICLGAFIFGASVSSGGSRKEKP